MTTTKAALDQQGNRAVHAAERSEAPAGWTMSLDREIPVKEGLRICGHYEIDLDGSAWTKGSREARRFDFACYVLGGGAATDRKRIGTLRGELARLRSRRDVLARRGWETAEMDRSIASMERNMEIASERIAAAGDGEDQAMRQAEMETAERILDGVRAEALRYRGQPMPEDLERRLDRAIERLDKAETAFAAGAAELEALTAAKVKAEAEVRSGLAYVLRDRVLKRIASRVREAMAGKVALYLRRPEKALPPEAQSAMYEAEAVCDIADRLGTPAGILPLAHALGEELSGVLYPKLQLAERRPPRSEARDMGAGFDRELGFTA